MTAINEELTFKVFTEMVRYRPALARYLPDNAEGEEVDLRILSDLVIKNFPWPIGVELRRLFSGTMRYLGRQRLDQILKTIERTMQFFSFVMVGQVWYDITKNKLTIPENFRKEFTEKFLILSMGNFCWLIRTLGTLYSEQKISWFLPEMNDGLIKSFLLLWISGSLKETISDTIR